MTHSGFGLLAGLWFLTAWFVYSLICGADIGFHREWMIRNYALTFAAVTLRLYLPFLIMAFHVKIMQAYLTVSWLFCVPNLRIAEVLVRGRRSRMHLI